MLPLRTLEIQKAGHMTGSPRTGEGKHIPKVIIDPQRSLEKVKLSSSLPVLTSDSLMKIFLSSMEELVLVVPLYFSQRWESTSRYLS